jgi:hypothetical protein
MQRTKHGPNGASPLILVFYGHGDHGWSMHTTLKPRTNLALIVVSALLGAAALSFTRPLPLTPAAIGAFIGGVVGFLQSRSIGDARDAFRRAGTAMDVRRTLMSSTSGKLGIQIQWLGAVVLVAGAIWIGNPLGGFIAGYAFLMAARDIVALSAVVRLERGSGAVEQ